MIVAVGGGGDAITAATLRRVAHLDTYPPILTYSWDRLLVDPVPGPRTRSNFVGLSQLAPDVYQVTATTATVAPAGSSLPRLAAELPCRLILLDPTRGAVDMAKQISAAAAHFAAEAILAVDVGGDSLTSGTEPGLRSPLADQLALAACARTNLPTSLLVAGAGIDGELTTDTLTSKFHRFDARQIGRLTTEDTAPVAGVFTWHPSEASGLLAAAASGLRGTVEVRDAGDQVALTDDTCVVYAVDLANVIQALPAHLLIDTVTLAEAEGIIQSTTGISELQYEARKAARLLARAERRAELKLDQVDALANEARRRGADLVSIRRLAELLGASSLSDYNALIAMLGTHRPDNLAIGTYRTSTKPDHAATPGLNQAPAHPVDTSAPTS